MKLNFEDEMMDVCEEQDCSEPAARVWNGRNLCLDHYETYSMWEVRIPAEH